MGALLLDMQTDCRTQISKSVIMPARNGDALCKNRFFGSERWRRDLVFVKACQRLMDFL